MDILRLIRDSAARKILFTPHAVGQMSKPDRLITSAEVRQAVEKGAIIEDYPNDNRGHSCLMRAETLEGRVIHVVCSPKEDYLAVITAYLPSDEEWERGYRKRKKQ